MSAADLITVIHCFLTSIINIYNNYTEFKIHKPGSYVVLLGSVTKHFSLLRCNGTKLHTEYKILESNQLVYLCELLSLSETQKIQASGS